MVVWFGSSVVGSVAFKADNASSWDFAGKSMVAAGGCTFACTAIATPDHGAVASYIITQLICGPIWWHCRWVCRSGRRMILYCSSVIMATLAVLSSTCQWCNQIVVPRRLMDSNDLMVVWSGVDVVGSEVVVWSGGNVVGSDVIQKSTTSDIKWWEDIKATEAIRKEKWGEWKRPIFMDMTHLPILGYDGLESI